MTRWMCWRRAGAEPRVTLLCLTYAGGGPWVFRPWLEQMPVGVEIRALLLPGRGTLEEQPHATSLREIVDALISQCRDWGAKGAPPYAVFGYSMGALLGFELVRALSRLGELEPACFFAAACRPPHLPKRIIARGRSDTELLRTIEGLSTSEGAAGSRREQLMKNLGLLRADLELVDGHSCVGGALLSCPIRAYAGTDDPLASLAEMRRWADLTRSSALIEQIRGDHFFIHRRHGALVSSVARELERVARHRFVHAGVETRSETSSATEA